MTDSYADHETRRTLLTAFPAPHESVHGNWEHVVELAVARPTRIGHVFHHRRAGLRTGRRTQLVIALAAGAILLIAVGVAVAAKTGLISIRLDSGLNVLETPRKAHVLQREKARLHRHRAAGRTGAKKPPVSATEPPFVPDPIPAHMLPAGTPVPVAPSILQVTNDWLDSDGYTLVAVYAGSAGSPTSPDANASVGRVVIVRQDLAKGTQSGATLDVADSGALTITSAPEGASVEKSALTGDIELQATNGRSYVLHLATDRISTG